MMTTDEVANVVWRAKHLPYGEVYPVTGPAPCDYRFSPVNGSSSASPTTGTAIATRAPAATCGPTRSA